MEGHNQPPQDSVIGVVEHDNSENPEAEHHNFLGDDTFPNRPEKDERTLGAVAPDAWSSYAASLRCSIFVEVWPAHNLLQECSSAVSATLIPPSKVHCRSGGD